MPVPSVIELVNPVLRAMRSLDAIASKEEILEEVIRDMALSPEIVSELRESGTETRLNARFTMILTYLKSYGAIDNPKRGTWVLTPLGLVSGEVDAREVVNSYANRSRDPRNQTEGVLSGFHSEQLATNEKVDDESEYEEYRPRESIEIQSLVAQVGRIMGMDIWVPTRDRTRVSTARYGGNLAYWEALPFSYDDETLRTIERIDVIWVNGNFIERAFEVEHTTAIYSGLLRMADLLALQPNINIKLHIVAPMNRRDQVFKEISRPVFQRLQSGPLAQVCTYVSYDYIWQFSEAPSLRRLRPDVLDDYAESYNTFAGT